MSFIPTKFNEILFSGFRGIALTKNPPQQQQKRKERNIKDWLTDLTDRSKQYILRSS